MRPDRGHGATALVAPPFRSASNRRGRRAFAAQAGARKPLAVCGAEGAAAARRPGGRSGIKAAGGDSRGARPEA